MKSSLKVIIFDLDDTLLNTSETLLPVAQRESWSALRDLGVEMEWEEFLKQWQSSYGQKGAHGDLIETFVVNLNDLGLIGSSSAETERVYQHIQKAFYGREVKENLVLFDGAQEILDQLSQAFRLYLLTAGFEQTQRQKVEGLGIGKYFEEVFYCNLEKDQSKKDFFQSILKVQALPPNEFLSVGNRRDTDIGPAKTIGMKTCLLHKGEHLHQKPASESEIPDFEIESIRDLIKVCQTLAPASLLSDIPPQKP